MYWIIFAIYKCMHYVFLRQTKPILCCVMFKTRWRTLWKPHVLYQTCFGYCADNLFLPTHTLYRGADMRNTTWFEHNMNSKYILGIVLYSRIVTFCCRHRTFTYQLFQLINFSYHDDVLLCLETSLFFLSWSIANSDASITLSKVNFPSM